jgi:predicted hotdog family 3-hydroxylacyl-ACP dehydratase
MLQLGVSYRVEELVPHRGRMCLLDTIVGYGEDWLRAAVTPRPGGAFAEESGIPAWVGIEYMAQAAAAFGGIEQVQRGEPPSIGLLIGARYYRCMQDRFEYGAPLGVLVKIAMRDTEDFAAYDCRIELGRPDLGGREIAECTLKAYRPLDLAPLLAEAARD